MREPTAMHAVHTSPRPHRTLGSSMPIVVIALALIAATALILLYDPTPKSVLDSTEPQPEAASQPHRDAADTAPEASPPPAAPASAETQPQSPRPEFPPLVLDRDEVDFGYVLVGDTKIEEVVLFNRGDFPLTVQALHTACPCTEVEVEPRTIEPGTSSILTLRYTAQSYPHVAPRRATRIQLAEYPRQMVNVVTLASVGREIRLNSDRSPVISTMAGELRVESYDGRPFSILAVDGRAPEFIDFDPQTEAPRSLYTVRYNFASNRDDGSAPRHLHVLTDRESDPMAEIQVRLGPGAIDLLDAQPASWRAENFFVPLGILRDAGDTVERRILLKRTRTEGIEDVQALLEAATTRSVIGQGTADARSGKPAVSVEIISVEQGTKSATDYYITLRFQLEADTPAGLHHDILTLTTPNGNFTELDLVCYVPSSD